MAIPDNDIQKDIEDQLRWDSSVDESDIKLIVENGEVTLGGTVRTFREKRVAETNARVITGVVSVENNITVKHPTAATIPTDDEIAGNVRNMLIWNPILDEDKVDVTVHKGIVRLKGSVDSYWKKLRAEEIALDVRGVMDITNEIVVVPTEDQVDKTIAEDIINALKRNSHVNVDDINIEVEDGKVTLSGIVPKWQGIVAVRDAAFYTTGVTDVKNYLSISE
jgi:osmotically-inducible protein OsmY